MTIGIYRILNIIDNKMYIGQTRDSEKRWKQHKWGLNNNRHNNNYLQNAWNKHSENNFSFEILEECEPDELNDREIYYIKKYKTFEDRSKGYNLNAGGNAPEVSEETKRKMSEAHTGKKDSPETKAKKSKAKLGENNPFYNKTHSDESKRKNSETNSMNSNNTGFYRVTKHTNKTCKQGYSWDYRYYDEDRERKTISNTDLSKLMLKVTLKDLPWRILDIEKALDTINEINN